YFAESEERVDPVITVRLIEELVLVIEGVDLLLREQARSVEALGELFVAVELQDISLIFVDEQAADREVLVEGEVLEALGVAAFDQPLDGQAHAQGVHRVLLVDRERVIHVETDPVDLGQMQISIREDAILAGDRVTFGGLEVAGEREIELEVRRCGRFAIGYAGHSIQLTTAFLSSRGDEVRKKRRISEEKVRSPCRRREFR